MATGMNDQERIKHKAAQWVIREAAKVCGTSPDLILSRPRSAPAEVKDAAFRGFRVAVGAMVKIGLSRRDSASALNTMVTTVSNVLRDLRVRRKDREIVAALLSQPTAREFARQLAGMNANRLLADRLAALEQRVLALESGLRRLGNPDFRRLDALILAGWADIPQSNIPLEVLVRALLGLPVPSPGQYGFQHSRAICDLSPISMNRAC